MRLTTLVVPGIELTTHVLGDKLPLSISWLMAAWTINYIDWWHGSWCKSMSDGPARSSTTTRLSPQLSRCLSLNTKLIGLIKQLWRYFQCALVHSVNLRWRNRESWSTPPPQKYAQLHTTGHLNVCVSPQAQCHQYASMLSHQRHHRDVATAPNIDIIVQYISQRFGSAAIGHTQYDRPSYRLRFFFYKCGSEGTVTVLS